MIYISRKEHFSASHRLFNKNLTDKDNNDLFGKCNSLHGHNYYMEVTLCGEIDSKTGYLMDLKKLKDILYSEIISKVDHKNLNEVKLFDGVIPTTENMVIIFWNTLKDKIENDKVKLYSIKLSETDKNYVIYKG